MAFMSPIYLRHLLLVASVAATPFATYAQLQPKMVTPVPAFGQPLDCNKYTSPISVFDSIQDIGISEKNLSKWFEGVIKSMGFKAKVPSIARQKTVALKLIGMLKTGNIIAAKMGNDEAVLMDPEYSKSDFARAFDAILTISTQPVPHEETNTEEVSHGDAGSTDIGVASTSITDIIHRADATKRAMGKYFEMPSVRFYLLANGFKDPVAMKSAASFVCSLNLTPDVINKLNVSARYMAMPTLIKQGSTR